MVAAPTPRRETHATKALAEREGELKAERERSAGLEGQLAKAQEEIERLRGLLKESEAALVAMTAERDAALATAKMDAESLAAKVTELEGKVGRLEDELATERENQRQEQAAARRGRAALLGAVIALSGVHEL